MIKWYFYHLSPKSYDLMCTSQCVKLPSQCTIEDITYFSNYVNTQLIIDSDIKGIEIANVSNWQ